MEDIFLSAPALSTPPGLRSAVRPPQPEQLSVLPGISGSSRARQRISRSPAPPDPLKHRLPHYLPARQSNPATQPNAGISPQKAGRPWTWTARFGSKLFCSAQNSALPTVRGWGSSQRGFIPFGSLLDCTSSGEMNSPISAPSATLRVVALRNAPAGAVRQGFAAQNAWTPLPRRRRAATQKAGRPLGGRLLYSVFCSF